MLTADLTVVLKDERWASDWVLKTVDLMVDNLDLLMVEWLEHLRVVSTAR